jgi:hypothetical protein
MRYSPCRPRPVGLPGNERACGARWPPGLTIRTTYERLTATTTPRQPEQQPGFSVGVCAHIFTPLQWCSLAGVFSNRAVASLSTAAGMGSAKAYQGCPSSIYKSEAPHIPALEQAVGIPDGTTGSMTSFRINRKADPWGSWGRTPRALLRHRLPWFSPRSVWARSAGLFNPPLGAWLALDPPGGAFGEPR